MLRTISEFDIRICLLLKLFKILRAVLIFMSEMTQTGSCTTNEISFGRPDLQSFRSLITQTYGPLISSRPYLWSPGASGCPDLVIQASFPPQLWLLIRLVFGGAIVALMVARKPDLAGPLVAGASHLIFSNDTISDIIRTFTDMIRLPGMNISYGGGGGGYPNS